MFQKKIQQNIRQINNSPINTHEQEECSLALSTINEDFLNKIQYIFVNFS
jgi:hypothetical protein